VGGFLFFAWDFKAVLEALAIHSIQAHFDAHYFMLFEEQPLSRLFYFRL